jgi:TrmH family RNA methyltransferase
VDSESSILSNTPSQFFRQGVFTIVRPLKWYKSLSESKSRLDEGYFLLEGKKAIDQVFDKAPQAIEEILVTSELQDSVQKYQCPTRVLAASQLHTISSVKTSQGVAALIRIPGDSYSNVLPLTIGKRILLLEHVQDPGNVGTLIRTAAAFNYSGIILSNQCADPFSSKVVQATSGSLFSVWIRKTKDYLHMIARLKNLNYKVFTADVHGERHVDFSFASNHVLVLGSEGPGLTLDVTALADVRFAIPIESSHAESLNVAVCGGIAMFAGAMGKGW